MIASKNKDSAVKLVILLVVRALFTGQAPSNICSVHAEDVNKVVYQGWVHCGVP